MMDRRRLFGPVAAVLICINGLWPRPGLADDLPLAAGEVVNVDVYGREDLSGEQMIDAAGMLLVPLLGRVEAAKASPEVLEQRISAALSEAGLIERAQVFIAVVHRRDVFVDGDVMQPAAHAWRPGLTAGQAVTLAGGMRRVAAEQLGTALQAYSAVERFAALQLQVTGLQVQEARLRAELSFVRMAFDPSLTGDAAGLNGAAFVPADAAVSVADALAALDSARFRALQLTGAARDLIVFSAEVLADPATEASQRAQAAVMENHVAIWLANLNSLQLQRRALVEKARTLSDRRAVIDALVVTMQERLNTLLALRADGLVRAGDVVDMQTAYSTLIATQLDLLGDIADTQIAMEQQDLAINSYAATLSRDIGQELASVVATLTEAQAHLPDAERAATLAKSYQGAEAQGADPATIRYRVRAADAAGWREAQATTVLLPGDTVAVDAGGDF